MRAPLIAALALSLASLTASAQPPPAQPPAGGAQRPARPRRPVPPQIANLDLNVEQIGFRDEGQQRTVFVKVRVVRARGTNPAAQELVPAPAQPLGTLPAGPSLRDRPSFRAGDSIWLAYRCRLERGNQRGCGVGTNHPTGLLSVGRTSIQLLLADIHADEAPIVEVVQTRGPPRPANGPVFRLMVDGVANRIVIQVQLTDPGTLRTDTGPMVVP